MNRLADTSPSPESGEDLDAILRRHAVEQFQSGVYQSWIATVDKYFSGKNPREQGPLSLFARAELPLVATVRRNGDIRYPGLHAYFLLKVDPTSKEAIRFNHGDDPIIVAHVDNDGNIIEDENKDRADTYTDEQIGVVVRQAHELEMIGYSPKVYAYE